MKIKCNPSIMLKSLVIILLTIVSATVCANIHNPMIIRRGADDRTCAISNDKSIEQRIILSNTKKICITFLNQNERSIENSDAKIVVSLIQKNVKQDIIYPVKELPNRWKIQDLKFNFSEYKNDEATIKIQGENLKEGDTVVVILASGGNQILDFDNVIVGGEVQDGMYLSLSYGFFVWSLWIKYIIFFGLIWVALILSMPFIKNFIVKFPIPFLAIVILVLKYLEYEVWHKPLDSWMTSPYLINYSYGFVSKALPGSIYSLFSDYVSASSLRIIFHITFFVLVFLIICHMIKWLNNSNGKRKKIISTILLYYLCGPFFITFYYRQWGRAEIILIIIFIVSAAIITKGRNLAMIPILSIIAILTHQIYMFVFFPITIMMLIYQIVINKRKKFIIPTIIDVIISCVIAVYVQFFGSLSIPYALFRDICLNRTDTIVNDTMIVSEYYLPFKEFVLQYAEDAINTFRPVSLWISCIAIIPLGVLLVKWWKKLLDCHKSKTHKLIILVFALCPLASFPMFITISDYGRMLVMLGNAVFFSMLFMCQLKDGIFIDKAIEVYDEMNKKYGEIHIIVLCIYLTMISTAEVGVSIAEVSVPVSKMIRNLFYMFTQMVKN